MFQSTAIAAVLVLSGAVRCAVRTSAHQLLLLQLLLLLRRSECCEAAVVAVVCSTGAQQCGHPVCADVGKREG
jgi:hypothetical protein